MTRIGLMLSHFAHFFATFHETTLKLSATKNPTSNLIFTEMVAVQVEIENKMYNDGDPILQGWLVR